MILHICPNSKIFLPVIMSIFEHCHPEKNIYLVYGEKCCVDSDKVICLKKINDIRIDFLYSKISLCNFVFVHRLTLKHAELTIKLHNRFKNIKKIVWFVFGSDLLNVIDPGFLEKIRLSNTNKLLWKMLYKEKHVILPFYLLARLFYRLYQKYLYRKSLKCIDYVAPIIESEFLLLSQNVNVKSELLNFSYTFYEFNAKQDVTLGRDILVGNSSSSVNNHVDVFHILKNFSINDRKIVVPLSYGDKKYANEIIKIGEKYFHDNFNPILELVQIDKYNEILRKCSHVIIEGKNQHALGTILLCIFNGSKVFMNINNPLYHLLKDMGIVLYTTFELIKEPLLLDSDISRSDVDKNRSIILQNYGKTIAEKKVIDLLCVLSTN